MKVSKEWTVNATELRNAAHVILQDCGNAAHTMSQGKPIPHHEAMVLGFTMRRVDLSNGKHMLNISSENVNYMTVHWGNSGGVYATRFVPGPWEQAIRDAAGVIDPNWPKWAGLSFIDVEALKVPVDKMDAGAGTLAEAAWFWGLREGWTLH